MEKIENHKIYEADELREFVEHKILLKIANKFYHNGISCLDIINWVENTKSRSVGRIHAERGRKCWEKDAKPENGTTCIKMQD